MPREAAKPLLEELLDEIGALDDSIFFIFEAAARKAGLQRTARWSRFVCRRARAKSPQRLRDFALVRLYARLRLAHLHVRLEPTCR